MECFIRKNKIKLNAKKLNLNTKKLNLNEKKTILSNLNLNQKYLNSYTPMLFNKCSYFAN